MVGGPLRSDKLALLIDLVFEVISESVKSVHEVLFKCIESLMHQVHLLHCEFLVVCDVSVIPLFKLYALLVSVGEALFELPLGLDTGILHVLEVLRHVLHLVLELLQVFILATFLLDHICS